MNLLPFTQKIQFDMLDAARCALLIVDMNADFACGGGALYVPSSAAIVANVRRLAQACRDHDVPVLYAVHAHRHDRSDMGLTGRYREPIWAREALIEGTKGVELHPALRPHPEDIVFYKQRHDAFYGTKLELITRQLKLEALIVAGTVTQVCCEATVRAAFYRDLVPIVVTDGVAPLPLPDVGFGAFSAEEAQRFTLTKLGAVYAKLTSTTQVCDWLSTGH